MVSAEGMSVSLWDAHSVDSGVYIVMIGYAAGIAMGAMAMKGSMLRWQAIVALVGFGIVLLKMRGGILDSITHGAIGAKLLAVAAIGGVVFSALCIAKPAQAK
jgi:hypothetical protein